MKNISPKYLSKISLLISALLISLMLIVSCAPQQPLTDEELKAELAKLTPEERAQLVKDLESGEKGGAIAGQAISARYAKISPNIARRIAVTPAVRVRTVVNNFGGVQPIKQLPAVTKPMNIKNTTSPMNITNTSMPPAGNASKPMNVMNTTSSANITNTSMPNSVNNNTNRTS